MIKFCYHIKIKTFKADILLDPNIDIEGNPFIIRFKTKWNVW